MINSPFITSISAKEKKQIPIDDYRLLTDDKPEATHSKSDSKTDDKPEATDSKSGSKMDDKPEATDSKSGSETDDYIPKSTSILTKEFTTAEPDTLSFDESDARQVIGHLIGCFTCTNQS
jgi:hypothetical protein